MNTFLRDLKRGEQGERAVINTMISRGHTVEDLTSNKEFFEKDIDFIVSGKTCELKTDYVIGRTGNLFLEDYMEYTKDFSRRSGFFNTSEAEFLFYLDAKNKVLYIYDFEQLRAYVKENSAFIKRRSCNDGYKVIYGYCLNKDAVNHQTIYLN